MRAEMKRTWAEVSMDRLAHNYRNLRALTPYGTKFLGLVKADAYGHGAVPVGKKLEELGADYLGVACLDEAIILREGGITRPVLVLGYTDPRFVAELELHDITQSLLSEDYALHLNKVAFKILFSILSSVKSIYLQ